MLERSFMALDACVYCRCFEEGKTKALPFDAAMVECCEDGEMIVRMPDHTPASEALWQQLDEWEKDCCEHAGRMLAVERVANMAGQALLRSAFNALGENHFPILFDKIVKSKHAIITNEKAKEALLELAVFERKIEQGLHAVAVLENDYSAEEVVVDAVNGGYLLVSQQGSVFLREDGFMITEPGSSKIAFQAMNFTQTQSFDRQEKQRFTLYADKATGLEHRMVIDPLDFGMKEPAVELSVYCRKSQLKDFEKMIYALKTLFEASVKSTNPVKFY